MGKDIEALVVTWLWDNAAVIDEIVALQGDDAATRYGSAVAAYMGAMPKWTPPDAGGAAFDLPFSKMLAPSARRSGAATVICGRELQQTMATTQRLQSEVAAALVSVQSTLAETFSLLSHQGWGRTSPDR